MTLAEISFAFDIGKLYDGKFPEEPFDLRDLFIAIADGHDIEAARITREMIELLDRGDLMRIWAEHFGELFRDV